MANNSKKNRDVDVFKFEVQVCVPDCTDQRICDKAYFQMNGEFVGTDAADYHCGENDCKNGAACHYLTKFFEYLGLRGFRCGHVYLDVGVGFGENLIQR